MPADGSSEIQPSTPTYQEEKLHRLTRRRFLAGVLAVLGSLGLGIKPAEKNPAQHPLPSQVLPPLQEEGDSSGIAVPVKENAPKVPVNNSGIPSIPQNPKS